LPVRPVVLDARDLDGIATIEKLHLAGAPVVARISSTLRLVTVDLPQPGHHADPRPAHHIITAAKNLRRPVTMDSHLPPFHPRTSLAAAAQVRIPGTTNHGSD